MNITESYCSQKLMNLLKEHGFMQDIDCTTSKVTHSLAMTWLRKKHNLFITIYPEYEYYVDEEGDWLEGEPTYIFYRMRVERITKDNKVMGETWTKPIEEEHFETFENACESSIAYCLIYILG